MDNLFKTQQTAEEPAYRKVPFKDDEVPGAEAEGVYVSVDAALSAANEAAESAGVAFETAFSGALNRSVPENSDLNGSFPDSVVMTVTDDSTGRLQSRSVYLLKESLIGLAKVDKGADQFRCDALLAAYNKAKEWMSAHANPAEWEK